MQDLPAGARYDADGSQRLADQAALTQSRDVVGTSRAATGVRPMAGALPNPVDEADADPLRFQFRWGANLGYTPRSGYGTPYAQLRALVNASPELAMCIQTRKDQMASLDIDFAPRDKKNKSNEVKNQINAARAIFARPDRVTPLKSWLQMLVDEVLVVDALSIFKRQRRGGGIYGYEILDGTTIKVLLDDSGSVPLPPNVAYRQIINGTPLTGGDLTTDQLIYAPKNVRTWTPYGMSPTESLLLIVTAALNRTMFNLNYYVKGNIPEALVGVPDTWSTKTIRQFNDYWNWLMTKDPDNRAGLRFVPGTLAKNVHEFKRADFTTTWELWLLKVICACYGVTPSEVGFTDDVNKATSKTQGDVNQRRGIKPMAYFIKGIVDAMLAGDLGLGDLEMTFSGGEGEDALSQAKIVDMKLRNGTKGLDEVRAENGDPPIGVPPFVMTATGPVFLDIAYQQALDGAKAAKQLAETGGIPPEGAAPAEGDGTPAEGDEGVDDKQTAEKVAAIESELRKYATVATKAIKAGRAVPAFTSTILSTTALTTIAAQLATAESVEQVTKIFGDVRANVLKAQRLSAAQKKERAAMARKITKVLQTEGKAFGRHLSAGLDA